MTNQIQYVARGVYVDESKDAAHGYSIARFRLRPSH
jgi:hypothetical protein